MLLLVYNTREITNLNMFKIEIIDRKSIKLI